MIFLPRLITGAISAGGSLGVALAGTRADRWPIVVLLAGNALFWWLSSWSAKKSRG